MLALFFLMDLLTTRKIQTVTLFFIAEKQIDGYSIGKWTNKINVTL